MNNFDNYFSVYEATDPPPIITDGYKMVQDNYNLYLSPQLIYPEYQIIDNESQDDSKNLFNINTEPPEFKFTKSSINSTSLNRVNNLNNDLRAFNIVNLARLFVGTKYQWGGITPSTGFDCSGLILYVYKLNGIKLPRTVKDLEKTGSEVPSINEVKIGDLICTPGSGKSGKHIKIVSKIENGLVYTIEAKGKKYGIIESPLTDISDITSIRRIINDKSSNSVINYFISKGLTRNLAKGIYGNLMLESRGNISARSKDGNNSYGLALWTGSRKEKLFDMYGNNPTFKLQLDFLWWELNNTHKGALNSLKNTITVADATKVFMDLFERPHKDYANFSRRLKYANSII